MFCDTTSCEFVNSYSHCLFWSPFGLVLENSLPLNIQYMITPTYRRRVQHERTMGKGAGFYFHASFSIRGWDEFVNMAKKRRDRSGVWGEVSFLHQWKSSISWECMGLLLHNLHVATTLPTLQYRKGLQEILEYINNRCTWNLTAIHHRPHDGQGR